MSIERCPECGAVGGHGYVHERYGNGGGSNHPCPRASLIPEFTAPWGETFFNVRIQVGRYTADGSLAVALYTEDDEPLATPTVCLAEYDLAPTEGCLWLKDYSEGEGMVPALVDQGVVEPTGRVAVFGPFDTRAVEARLLSPYSMLVPVMGDLTDLWRYLG